MLSQYISLAQKIGNKISKYLNLPTINNNQQYSYFQIKPFKYSEQ